MLQVMSSLGTYNPGLEDPEQVKVGVIQFSGRLRRNIKIFTRKSIRVM